MSDLGTILSSFLGYFPDPVTQDTRTRVERELVCRSYGDSIFLSIFRDDEECWTASDFYTLPLADSIGESSLMLPEDIPTCIEDISWFFGKAFLEKFFQTDCSHEAESLRVFSLCIWESYFLCDCSYFRL